MGKDRGNNYASNYASNYAIIVVVVLLSVQANKAIYIFPRPGFPSSLFEFVLICKISLSLNLRETEMFPPKGKK